VAGLQSDFDFADTGSMRPVLRYGMSPDGIHRYLYSLADSNNTATQGVFHMYPRMQAMEYGLPFKRFALACKELIDDGRLVPLREDAELPACLVRGPQTRMQPFLVQRPQNYNPESERDPASLTADEIDHAIELFEQLTDQIEDAWDEDGYEEDENDDTDRDETGPDEGLRVSTNQN
jgi:hypothetical protein